MENSFLVLKKLSTELNNLEGIVMYSMFQLPTQKKLRMEIFKNFKKRNKKIFFALENKEYNSETKNLIEEIWDIKNVIMQKQYQFQI